MNSGAIRRGQVLAALILVGWLASLVAGLQVSWRHAPPLLLLLAVLLRTFLQTGLFIVGHDAMHRLLVPAAPTRNDRWGALFLALYAALPFGLCQRNHRRHHSSPGQEGDPDFHRSGRGGWLQWYTQFMGRYLGIRQMVVLIGAWGVLAWCSSVATVLLICTLPLLLSSLQLFLVGTYLPHREGAWGSHPHEPLSLPLPEWLSLLACFHFGYHREHHHSPGLAWHQLPQQRRECQAVALATAGSPQ